MAVIAECHFLDVGQGSSNVIYLGGGSVAVIDCPKGHHSSSEPTLRLLERYKPSTIEILAVTHNDADHDAGAVDVLQAYVKRIQRVCFLQDRGLSQMTRFRSAVEHEVRLGNLDRRQVVRLEKASNGMPKAIWRDDQKGLELLVLYPDLIGNLHAQAGDPNATSAVILLKSQGARVLFPGDCGADGWEVIYTDNGKKRIEIAVMAAPHHGGCLDGASPIAGKNVFQWLYEDVLHVGVGVVSVGTFNTYNHPHKDAVQALRHSGAEVMCTQMTSQCCTNLATMGKGLRTHSSYALSQLGPWRTLAAKKPQNIACAGTVIVEIADDGIHMPSLHEHNVAVRNCPGLHPLCV